jgi:peptidoglycan hydrolase-like protein with peptidoglycan-binding domain
MPDEASMSKADRQRVQEALRRLGYYKGGADGTFGPLTREAIRRYQGDIGAEKTGRLTAEDASRLFSTH